MIAGTPGHEPMAYLNTFGDVSNHLGLFVPDLAMLQQKVAPRLQLPSVELAGLLSEKARIDDGASVRTERTTNDNTIGAE